MSDRYIPDAIRDIERFIGFLKSEQAFTFIRFSDGEIEILRNRYLEIDNGVTVFRGRVFQNTFPVFDRKKFDPEKNADIRCDLLTAATRRGVNFFKGVPTRHNRAVLDREFLLRLNGGMSEFMTFSDLLMNSNYGKFRREFIPTLARSKNIAVIANYRAKLSPELGNAVHIPVRDNFFDCYQDTLSEVMQRVLDLPLRSVILSSASSLSNIVGLKLHEIRPDITFVDVGSAINDLLGMDSLTRAYHQVYTRGEGFSWWSAMRYKKSKEYQIQW